MNCKWLLQLKNLVARLITNHLIFSNAHRLQVVGIESFTFTIKDQILTNGPPSYDNLSSSLFHILSNTLTLCR
jgi:hypothetical protein